MSYLYIFRIPCLTWRKGILWVLQDWPELDKLQANQVRFELTRVHPKRDEQKSYLIIDRHIFLPECSLNDDCLEKDLWIFCFDSTCLLPPNTVTRSAWQMWNGLPTAPFSKGQARWLAQPIFFTQQRKDLVNVLFYGNPIYEGLQWSDACVAMVSSQPWHCFPSFPNLGGLSKKQARPKARGGEPQPKWRWWRSLMNQRHESAWCLVLLCANGLEQIGCWNFLASKDIGQ